MKSVWEALSIVRKLNLHTMKGNNNINCVMSTTRALSMGNREFGPPEMTLNECLEVSCGFWSECPQSTKQTGDVM